MKNLLTILTFLCLYSISVNSSAQYAITPVSPPPSFTFNDLWHFTVLRATEDKYTQFYVSLRIFDAKNTLKVKSNSNTVIFPVGSNYYNISNISFLEPVITSYYDASALQHTITSGGQFPAGVYNIVYTLYGKMQDGEFMPLSEDAIQTNVEMMWPPILIWPEDESTLTDLNPTLTWTPAFGSTCNEPILYDIKITEILSGQSKEQAIIANRAFFITSDQPNAFYSYGIKEPVFESSKKYAWQVTAKLCYTEANSQVWEFSVGQPSMLFVPLNIYYSPLLEKLDASFSFATDYKINLKYIEEYEIPTSTSKLLYNIYQKTGAKIASNLPPYNDATVAIKRGDNYITLDVSGLPIATNEYYILEVMNHKNEKMYLRFIVPE